MADLVITAANVKPIGTTTAVQRVQFGESVTHGQPVYRKSADGKYYRANATTSIETAEAKGIAVTPGLADEYGYIVTEGTIALGAALTVGEIYVCSGTAGGIAPEADLSTGEYVTILGVAVSTAQLCINIFSSDAQIP